ncbi:prenyltransferase [Halostagnicola larsenii XH-48]|uniref:Prenyltransferase n=1 Tax=Halostagnicola larsenii XH-48 TaxID=797299 RepID=W0JQU4_9EURY|nr:UbiA family prenyltransferase [Halostagnicola larsenii]AHF99656.1 prenyltransferase [Halostagnicola larsenii XH-48]
MALLNSAPRLESARSRFEAVALFLVHSNLHISLSATSIALVTMLLVDLPIDPVPLFIVFAAAMFVYSLNRFTDLEEDEQNVPGRAAFTREHGRLLLALGVGLYLIAIVVAVVLDLPGARYTVIPLLVTIAYSFFRLKRVFLVKNLTVGVAWGLIPLGVGFYYDVLETTGIVFLAAYVTAMLTIAAIVFDIKDIDGDRAAGISTVPVVFDPHRTRILAQISNVAVAASVLICVAVGLVPPTFLVLLAFNAYVGGYIPFATRDRSVLFYGFIIDGEQLFLACCVLALELTAW